MKKDYFDVKSKGYETDEKRVDNVKNIADGIIRNVNLKKSDVLLDFGSGTGLLTKHISKYVKKIIVNDISSSMNEQLREKIKKNEFDCDIHMMSHNMCETSLPLEPLDGIISSMTIHHVNEVKELMRQFFKLLKKEGFLALADLETENGTFHQDDTGVFHFGFDKQQFLSWVEDVGFINAKIQTISVAEKPHGKYPIFLLVAQKPA
ncbi:MAG: class I SAM-dependent methyltransferase [Arcobacteraceae bacterium]|jgi:ubiquinone/menaquinone biosynthesis C-methylase UbiE|nr:class I SAM-dependent methyltransferase [Arcobacteraceae bacterium]